MNTEEKYLNTDMRTCLLERTFGGETRFVFIAYLPNKAPGGQKLFYFEVGEDSMQSFPMFSISDRNYPSTLEEAFDALKSSEKEYFEKIGIHTKEEQEKNRATAFAKYKKLSGFPALNGCFEKTPDFKIVETSYYNEKNLITFKQQDITKTHRTLPRKKATFKKNFGG